MDKVLNVYEQLSQTPNLSDAKINYLENNIIQLQTVWDQRCVKEGKNRKHVQDFYLDADLNPYFNNFPRDCSTELLVSSSDDGQFQVILRESVLDGKTKQIIEIWNKNQFISSYDLSSYDVHGKVYFDSTFSTFELSYDNTKLLYVAEKKLPKSKPFYTTEKEVESDEKEKKGITNKSKNNDQSTKGTEYLYKPDWGEQLVGKHRSVLAVLNIQDGTIEVIDSIPDDYFPAQAIWAPNGDGIVGITYKLHPRYLGLVFCTNRESYIFHVKGSEFHILTSEKISCRSPRFSPNGKYLIWLERDVSPVHNNVQRLVYLKWNEEKKPIILIGPVRTFVHIMKDKKFYGLFNQNLPKRCWSDDSEYIFFSTPQRSNIKSFVVHIEGIIFEINNPEESSLNILDVFKNGIAFEKSSFVQPSQLIFGQFNPRKIRNEEIRLINCTNLATKPSLDVLFYETTEYVHNEKKPDLIKDFNFTYLGKKDKAEKSMPLVAVIHGGPHVTISNEFNFYYALFALLDFGVLIINYRGSIGMGSDSVQFLLGKIGTSDVFDCITAISTTLEKYPWLDPNNVSAFGGSHGGFIIAHLTGQYPDMFKAVAIRNPVVDLSTMFTISDIPDWCAAECKCDRLGILPETTPVENYTEMLETMLECSPIIHVNNVKTPTLLALGAKDLRVPCSQGRLWNDGLKANNVETVVYMYDDNHSLTTHKVETDFVINSIIWLMKHSGKGEFNLEKFSKTIKVTDDKKENINDQGINKSKGTNKSNINKKKQETTMNKDVDKRKNGNTQKTETLNAKCVHKLFNNKKTAEFVNNKTIKKSSNNKVVEKCSSPLRIQIPPRVTKISNNNNGKNTPSSSSPHAKPVSKFNFNNTAQISPRSLKVLISKSEKIAQNTINHKEVLTSSHDKDVSKSLDKKKVSKSSNNDVKRTSTRVLSTFRMSSNKEIPKNGYGKESPKIINGAGSPRIINGKESPKIINGTRSPKIINGKESPKIINSKELPNILNGKQSPTHTQVPRVSRSISVKETPKIVDYKKIHSLT